MCFVPSEMNGFPPVTVTEATGGGATSALFVNFATRLSSISCAGRRRSVVVIRKKQKFLVFASKQEPELNERENVAVKFGKVIGEDPRLTLPKIKARRLVPNATVLDAQKSFYKSKGNLLDIKLIPLDWAKPCREIRPIRRKAVSSVDGLNLVKPVIKKGVKFESRNKTNASGTRKPRLSVRKRVFEKRELTADDIELEKNLYQIIDQCGPALSRKPEPGSIDKKKELSSGEQGLVTNHIESKMVKEEAEVNQSNFTLLKMHVAAKTQPRLERKKMQYRIPEILVKCDVEQSGSRGTSESIGMKSATKDELDRLASALDNFLSKQAKKDRDKFEFSNKPNASESRKSSLSVQKPAEEKRKLSSDARTKVVADIELEKNVDLIIDKCSTMLLRKPEISGVNEYGYENQELSGGAKAEVVDDVKEKMTANTNIVKSDQTVLRKPESIDKKKEFSRGAKDLLMNHIELKMVKEEAEVKQSNLTLLKTPEAVQTQPRLERKKLQHRIPEVQVNDNVEQSDSRGTSESSEMNKATKDDIESLVSALGNLSARQAKKDSEKFESNNKPDASESRKSSLTVRKPVDEKRELSDDARTEFVDDIELEKNLYQILDMCGGMLLREPKPESLDKKRELSSGTKDLVMNNIKLEKVKEEAKVKQSNSRLFKTPEAVQTQPILERKKLQHRIPEVQVNDDVEQSGSQGTSESSETNSATEDELERLVGGLGNLLTRKAKKDSGKFESSNKPNALRSRKSSLTVRKPVDEKRELLGDAKTEFVDIELEKNLYQTIVKCGQTLSRKPVPESIDKKKELSNGAKDLVTNNIESEMEKEEAEVKQSNFTLLKTPEAVQTQPRLLRRNLQYRIPEVQVNDNDEQSGTRGTSESSEMKSATKDEIERLLNGLGNLLTKEAVQAQSEICNDLVKKKNLMAYLRIGDIVKCRITNIADFGIFVEVEGLPALIHHTEVSWDVTWDPSYFKIGQILEAKVSQLNYKLARISLSLRELLPDPLNDTRESVIGDDNPFDGRLQADTEADVEKELQQIEGVQSASKGQFLLSPLLAPTLQVLMAPMFENWYKLLARNELQEVIVRTSLDREEVERSAILRCTKRVG